MKTPMTTIALTIAVALAGCNASKPANAADVSLAAASPPAATAHAHPATPAATAVAAPKLQAGLRTLWHGHVVRTRDYAIADKAGNEAETARAADAVVANATSLADAVGSFYGPDAGAEMLRLLGGHWGGVKALTDAQLRGDEPGVGKAMGDLMGNGGEIAKFLAAANPNLPENAVLGLLSAHVGHHAAQVQQLYAGDTVAEAATWIAMQAHMDVLADAMAGAIAKQFPAKAS